MIRTNPANVICAAIAALAITVAAAGVAHADPDPSPTPPPGAPNCLSYGGQPFPHPRLLPCGWDWDGHQWTQLP